MQWKGSQAGQPALDENSGNFEQLTPREIVARLDEYIVGQSEAKRSVAIAIRNRLRRLRVGDELRDEIIPKNLILIGPTGVGKTEIARRMALLLRAPFIKVEATKFTEVGYVGRDVDSIVRDLTENSVRLVRQERMEGLRDTLMGKVIERLVDYMQPLPGRSKRSPHADLEAEERRLREEEERMEQVKRIREKLRRDLRGDRIDGQSVTIDAVERGQKMMQVFTSQGLEEMGMDLQNLFDGMGDKKPKRKKTTVGEAKRLLLAEEAERALDMESVVQEAVQRVEVAGIVFIDEMDKIAHREGAGSGPDVSREGVQRDLLPLVEGTSVVTKYGPVRTQHVLFVAAGAFHVSKVSDLIPELQGRFPLRVELQSLSEEDFGRILREPRNSLIRQYKALLATEGVDLDFTDEALSAMARHASRANSQSQNIGARRLHTVLERVLEDVSFDAPYEEAPAPVPAAAPGPAPEPAGTALIPADSPASNGSAPADPPAAMRHVLIDADYVNSRLEELFKDKDVAQYIL
ncbi:ATP-dependent protease ATPase subunit HslU [bacterium]|nr:ATP-dependent protease ATPase subunit HslU [bacterium]